MKNALASSQELPLPVPTPPALPAASEGTNAGTVVNSSNAQDFRALIIPEFYPLVRARLIEMDSVSSLRADLKTYKQELEPSADEAALLPSGELREGFKLKYGMPFPAWESEEDSKRRAQKLIWNVQAKNWNQKLIFADFSISYIEDSKFSKQLRGSWQRIYPGIMSPEDKTIQLFRELIQFNSPSILKGLNYLTFRFLGSEEDMLWLSSPVTKKVRELTGSNRSDPFLDSSFSPDDFLGWSGKVELSEVKYDKELTALVPFSSFDAKTLSSSGSCDTYKKPPPASPNNHWNYSSHRFPDAFPWLPTEAVFVPRQIIRLELVPKDPFSLYGRQILYIDKELMIPYYKFVFNRAGYLWKTVFNVPALYHTKDNARTYVFTDYTLIEDRQKKTANIFEFDNTNFCSAYTESIKLNNFEPQKLIPPAPPASDDKKAVGSKDVPVKKKP